MEKSNFYIKVPALPKELWKVTLYPNVQAGTHGNTGVESATRYDFFETRIVGVKIFMTTKNFLVEIISYLGHC